MEEVKTLTTGEAAKWCGVSFRTVLRWIQRGELAAYSLPGRGDRRILVEEFIAFLQRHKMPVPGGLSPGPTRVLLAEDDPADAEILTRILKKAGFETKVVADSFSAGAMAVSFTPAVMIVDLKMPGLGGRDLIRMVRAMPPLASLKLLVVSGMPQEVLDLAIEDGADAALQKPVDAALLVKTLDRLAGKARS